MKDRVGRKRTEENETEQNMIGPNRTLPKMIR